MEPVLQPSTLAEVEALIRALYEPNSPDTISKVQHALQSLQKGPEGWRLAQSLITNPDEKIKFFAALTLIVKLNRDSAELSEDDAKALLLSLISWFLQSLREWQGVMVPKKLCTTLVTYFIHFSHLWPRCVRHIAYCLATGQSCAPEAIDEALQTDVVVSNLSALNLRAAIWFISTFIEEVGKTDMNSPRYIGVHQRVMNNSADITVILARAIEGASAGFKPSEALECFQACTQYAQRAAGDIDLMVTPLRGLVEPFMKWLVHQELGEPAADVFADILSFYPTFFTKEQYTKLSDLLGSPWAEARYREITQTNHKDIGIAFASLLLAYGDAEVSKLMESTDDHSQRLLAHLSGLLACQGYLVEDDHVFVPALEFWSNFSEIMICNEFEGDQQELPWKPYAEGHLDTVVRSCWQKIQWPPVEEYASWDSANRDKFVEARKDVGDLVQCLFTLKGKKVLVPFFTEMFLQYIPLQAWAELEATAFCLGSLADCASEEAECDVELSKVFSDGLFQLLLQTQGIPTRLRQTFLSLIGRYSAYFQRHSEYLPHALNILFGAVGDAALGSFSARSISVLCSSCRSILTGEIPAFIHHYQIIVQGPAIDSLAEERIVLAISSIIQAVSDQDQRLDAFTRLYGIVKADFERALLLKAQPTSLDLQNEAFRRGMDPSSRTSDKTSAWSPDEIALQLALRSLRCLVSMAKGMQVTEDSIIDLDAEPQDSERSPKLMAIQEDTMNFITGAHRTFNTSVEVVDVFCNILRAGFSEVDPGPFVYPPEAVIEFFLNEPFDTPQLGTLLGTACSFAVSLSRGPKAVIPKYFAKLLPWVVGMLNALPQPEHDPEVAQNGILFVIQVLKYPEVLFQLQPTSSMECFFIFTLKVLDGKEPLPKATAADFWTSFLALKPENPDTRATFASAMETLGPIVAQVLMQNIGGNAARSELDKLSDPLKKLVVQQPGAPAWLEHALLGDSFPSTQVSSSDKMTFLKKIVASSPSADFEGLEIPTTWYESSGLHAEAPISPMHLERRGPSVCPVEESRLEVFSKM